LILGKLSIILIFIFSFVFFSIIPYIFFWTFLPLYFSYSLNCLTKRKEFSCLFSAIFWMNSNYPFGDKGYLLWFHPAQVQYIDFHCIVLGLPSPGNWGSSKFFRSVGSVFTYYLYVLDAMVSFLDSYATSCSGVLGFGLSFGFLSPFWLDFSFLCPTFLHILTGFLLDLDRILKLGPSVTYIACKAAEV